MRGEHKGERYRQDEDACQQVGNPFDQESLDVDKPQWAATVNSQGIPWISVNDGLGVDSPSVLAYNVNRIPQMFIIDRAGDIVANDIFDKDGLEKQIAKCL